MAGCCPPAPAVVSNSSDNSSPNGVEYDIRRGETVECFSGRAGNTTQLHDDATDYPPNKIENNTVPIVRSKTDARVDNLQFKLTVGSTRTATSWSIKNLPPGLTFSTSGVLNGVFISTAYGNVYKAEVTALDATGEIDTRGFTIAPSKGGKGDEIRLISPLPGAIVNSPYGNRVNPYDGIYKFHHGIDMKYSDHSIKDVVAAADGEVIHAGTINGYGLNVQIKHRTEDGKHLCNTSYNHLAKIYVANGQKLMAGQALGREGSTGNSTGPHLHFEVSLPDGKRTDPQPLINGKLLVAGQTLPNGDAKPGSLKEKDSKASMSAAEAQAKTESCAPFGPGYPPTVPPETTDAPPPPVSDDPFERAWYFTMTEEVGPKWKTTAARSPGDPELDAGLIETKTQRQKCGYVNTPNYPGGETKFGIAQKYNRQTVVRAADYATCRSVGFNNYWKNPQAKCTKQATLVGIMLFDITFLQGPGAAHHIYSLAGINSVPGDSLEKQIADVTKLYTARVAAISKIRAEYTPSWLKRADRGFAYVKSLPPPH